MRNYLYIPLGGNRKDKPWKVYINLWIVFLAVGFWHGANWTFILFGIWHGLWIALERLFLGHYLAKIPKAVAILWTFLLFVLGCVFFKAPNVGTAWAFFQEMFKFQIAKTPWEDLNLYLGSKFWFMMAIAALFSFVAAIPIIGKWQDKGFTLPEKGWQTVGLSVLALILLVLSISEIATMGFRPFIYYMF
jgi:alginate O-acetyltransferase complex protein AlgI